MEKNIGSPSGSFTNVAAGTILGKRKLRSINLPEYSCPEESLLKDVKRNTDEFTSDQRERDAFARRCKFLERFGRLNNTTETRLIGNSDSQRYEIEHSNNIPQSNELQPLKHEEQFQKLEVQTGDTPKLPSWILEKQNIREQSESKGSSSNWFKTRYIEKSQREPVVQNTALAKTPKPLATFCTDDLSVTQRALGTFQQSSSQPDSSNIISDRKASMDEVNEFDTCSFGQRGQVLRKIESNDAPKTCAEHKDTQTKGHSNVGNSEVFDKENKKSSLVEDFASRYGHNPDKSFILGKQKKLNLGSHRLEEKSRSKLDKSSLAAEKMWGGSIQLNSSIAVPAVAFFKSGEKLLDVKWSEFVDVKGKVRLDAFEKYIQDLSRSRNRGLTVISLCSNEGSETEIKLMKEVAEGYIRGERVGLARFAPGVDLYLCPRTDTIITILAKHGFFKGLAAIESKREIFIGCVVWRKNHTAKKPESKADQLPKLLPDSIDIHTASAFVPIKPESKTNGSQSEPSLKSLPELPESTDVQTVCNESSQKKPLNDDDDDLPEFDFGSALPKTPFADSGKKKIIFDDDDDMPIWLPPHLKKKKKFPKGSNIPAAKNLPFHHNPPGPLSSFPTPAPNPPRSAVSFVPPPVPSPDTTGFTFNPVVPQPPRNGPSFTTGFTFNHVLQPPRDGPGYMTGFTFNPVLQPCPRDGPSYMTGFTVNPVVQPPTEKNPLQPAVGAWRRHDTKLQYK